MFIGGALEDLTLYKRMLVFYYKSKKEFVIGISDPLVIAIQVLCQIPIVIYLAIQAFS